MKRTIWKDFKLPDAINRCNEKNNFTLVSNSFIRDPNISHVAKTILVLLLSNKEGWVSHKTTLKSMMKEGRDKIQKGLSELKKLGYLSYIGYRDKVTKEFKGSFWAYTDVANNFNYHKNVKILESKGMEVIVRKQAILPRNTEIPLYGKSATNNTIIKNKKIKEITEVISSKKQIKNLCPYNWKFGDDHKKHEDCQFCDDNDFKLCKRK